MVLHYFRNVDFGECCWIVSVEANVIKDWGFFEGKEEISSGGSRWLNPLQTKFSFLSQFSLSFLVTNTEGITKYWLCLQDFAITGHNYGLSAAIAFEPFS